MRCLFLASGAGGDYLALERAKERGHIAYDTAAVVNTVADGACLAHARDRGQPAVFLPPRPGDRAGFDAALGQIFTDTPFDLCFLTGFRYLLPADIVGRHDKKIMNSHHAILPGNPGLFRKEALVASDAMLLGATVHYVDSGVDTGQILCQAAFPNYGLPALDAILALFRRVQDVLVVTAFRVAAGLSFGPRRAVRGETLFWPAPAAADLDLFFPEKDTAR